MFIIFSVNKLIDYCDYCENYKWKRIIERMNTTRVLKQLYVSFFKIYLRNRSIKYKNNFYSRRLYFLYINAIFLIVIKGHDHSLVLLKNIHEFFFKIRWIPNLKRISIAKVQSAFYVRKNIIEKNISSTCKFLSHRIHTVTKIGTNATQIRHVLRDYKHSR